MVKSNDKRRARLNAMRHVLSLVDYTHKDHEIVGIPDPLIVGPASQVFKPESVPRRRDRGSGPGLAIRLGGRAGAAVFSKPIRPGHPPVTSPSSNGTNVRAEPGGRMIRRRQRLVVVGNGMAGERFVDELLAGDRTERWDVTVIGEEHCLPYDRTLLPRVLAGAKPASIVSKAPGWYADRGVTLLSGRWVQRLDTERRVAHIGNGETVAYDRGPRHGQRPHVAEDLRRDQPRRDEDGGGPRLPVPGRLPGPAESHVGRYARPGRGGGRGRAPRGRGGTHAGRPGPPGDGRAPPGGGAQAAGGRHRRDAPRRSSVEAFGIRFVIGFADALLVGRRVEAVALDDGRTVPADDVVFLTPSRPQSRLAAASRIECRRGVVVDDRLRTSAPEVYAVGECAEHRHVCFGRLSPCLEQATVLASVLAGADPGAVFRGASPEAAGDDALGPSWMGWAAGSDDVAFRAAILE